ncbi:MAG: SUMF1/EgtB/PvdO family nonheme iron enzyme [Candidatus Handelsmanbacteria bacterium]|nr:SUMF1/EgtB/PvdO family nonheme iron enzyme [Candidatus Handelsmanbacteria bacterium]
MWAFFLLASSLLIPSAWSLEVRGQVRLRLDDQPVPSALVRYLNEASGAVYETQTAEDGAYYLELPEPATAVAAPPPLPARTWLGSAYPNPFNPAVVLPLDLAAPARVRLEIFTSLGQPLRLLVDRELPAGTHLLRWDARDGQGRGAAAGVYLFLLSAGEYTARGKLTLADGAAGLPVENSAAPRQPSLYTIQVRGPAIHSLDLANVAPPDPGADMVLLVDADQSSQRLPSGQWTSMAGIPGGWFRMGSPFYQDEAPERQVYLDPYYLELHEVTLAQYRACVEAGACPEPAQGEACTWNSDRGDNHPVNCVSWYDAERYCRWAGMRLPTEAEWEKAARGALGQVYPWGDEPPGGAGNCQRAVMMQAGLGLGCGYDGPGPVGTRTADANPYGIRDLAGNVWEWTADWYGRDYYQHGPARNPLNTEMGLHRSLRGNSWFYVDPNTDLRAANRYRFRPLRWSPYIGIRCARSALPGPAEPPLEPPSPLELQALGLANWQERHALVMAAEGDTLLRPARPDTPMVFIPAGPCTLGVDRGSGDERPVHVAELSAFYLDRTEVTVAQYRACAEAGGCTPPHHGARTYRLEYEGRFTNWDQPGREDHPVNAVNWAQADQYCRWAGKRLPTEAEWEKAAGGDGRRYPWGDEEPSCERAVMDDGGDGCGQDSTWPVGSKPEGASSHGVMDLAGNVWEWVADWYDRDYYRRAPLRDPFNTDPGSESLKILRGGSLADQNAHLHAVSNRLAYDPQQGYDYTVGFRCARSAP